MKSFMTFILFLSALLLSACGKDYPDSANPTNSTTTIQSVTGTEKLNGLISNVRWQYNSGRAVRKISDPNTLIVSLWEDNIPNPCNFFGVPDKEISFSIAKRTGKYYLGAGNSVTISDNELSATFTASQGLIEISSVLNNTLVGSMNVVSDQSNKAKGHFSLTVCQ